MGRKTVKRSDPVEFGAPDHLASPRAHELLGLGAGGPNTRPRSSACLGKRATRRPSVRNRVRVPFAPRFSRLNSESKYSSRRVPTTTPPKRPSAVSTRRLIEMLGSPPRNRLREGPADEEAGIGVVLVGDEVVTVDQIERVGDDGGGVGDHGARSHPGSAGSRGLRRRRAWSNSADWRISGSVSPMPGNCSACWGALQREIIDRDVAADLARPG